MGSWLELRCSCWAMVIVDFAQIAREQSPSLFKRARQLTHDDARAWDLVQDTFERCLRSYPEHLPTDKVHAWLNAILNNLFIDETRTYEVRARVRLRDEDWQKVPAPSGDDAGSWRDFEPADVRACLDQLPLVLRQAFELHDLGGLNYREIAARLNVNRATVGTRILRARRHLCTLLQAAGPRVAVLEPRRNVRDSDGVYTSNDLAAWAWARSADAA
jgi:RNA polymerase sigma-70 factor (ECF subfamily)